MSRFIGVYLRTHYVCQQIYIFFVVHRILYNEYCDLFDHPIAEIGKSQN